MEQLFICNMAGMQIVIIFKNIDQQFGRKSSQYFIIQASIVAICTKVIISFDFIIPSISTFQPLFPLEPLASTDRHINQPTLYISTTFNTTNSSKKHALPGNNVDLNQFKCPTLHGYWYAMKKPATYPHLRDCRRYYPILDKRYRTKSLTLMV